MTGASGWPFLVARGRHKGYRTVLAPGFLVDLGLQDRLSEKTAAADPTMRSVDLDIPRAGRLTVLYCSEAIQDADLNGQRSGGRATDEHGRPLELLYGIVAREPLAQPLDEADRSAAREEALQSYRRFLSAEDSFGVDSSQPFSLKTPPQQPAVFGAPDDEPQRSGRNHPEVGDRSGAQRDRWLAPGDGGTDAFANSRQPAFAPAFAALALVLLGALLLAWKPWSPDPEPPVPALQVTGTTMKLVAARPATGCDAAVQYRLRARLAAGAPRSVTYHWEPVSAFESAAVRTLKLDGKSAQPVETTTLGLEPAQRRQPVRLVIDEPSAEPRTIEYVLRCP